MNNLIKIKKALISVSDKSDLKKILPVLSKYKIDIISSGETYKAIKKIGYQCEEISKYTGFKEILEGRVKTLHPKIHAGILSKRKNKKHQKDLKKNNFQEIDLVIVNFYPFEQVAEQINNFNSIIENIDIGGPTLVRAAAKNFKYVTVISNTSLYENLIFELNTNKGSTSLKFRKILSLKAFNEIAYYDATISNFFNEKNKVLFPEKKIFSGRLNEKLRYGENPHQEGAYYIGSNNLPFKQLHGKKLSFNNYNDIFSALSISKSFKKNTGTAIIKHTNPCGVSIYQNNLDSYKMAFKCDPISAFGGIIFCNFKIKSNLALLLKKEFFEIIIANSFDSNALKILKKKKNVRLIEKNQFKNTNNINAIFYEKSFLIQNSDEDPVVMNNLKIVSKKKPTKSQIENLIFALNVCRHVKSNAIVLANNKSTIGIGSGQPSRIDSCKIAIEKAIKFFPDQIMGCVAASDAFFPFTDGIEKLVQAGVNAIIQPYGSIRDKEIIKFADKTGTVLIFSKKRHFKH